MKFFLFPILLSIFLLPSASKEKYMIVGTYDSPKSEGIYVYTFNSEDGSAKEISHIKTSNPSFVTVSPDEKFVYSVHENGKDGKGGEIAAFSFNKKTGTLTFINQQLSAGDHPCFVEIDKTAKWVFSGNYSSGTLSVLPVHADGSLGAATTVIQDTGSSANLDRQKSAHVHSTFLTPDNKWLLVPDLGTDKVMIYAFDASTGKLTPSKQPFAASEPGSGPRHFAFSPNKKFAYLAEEMSGMVVAYKLGKGTLERVQRISGTTAGFTGSIGGADIHISSDGKFLYYTNRGDANTIATYKINEADGKLTLLDIQPTLGKGPRNFSIDPSGKFVLVAHQYTDNIVVFNRDKKTGLLKDSGKRIELGKPVCIKWINK